MRVRGAQASMGSLSGLDASLTAMCRRPRLALSRCCRGWCGGRGAAPRAHRCCAAGIASTAPDRHEEHPRPLGRTDRGRRWRVTTPGVGFSAPHRQRAADGPGAGSIRVPAEAVDGRVISGAAHFGVRMTLELSATTRWAPASNNQRGSVRRIWTQPPATIGKAGSRSFWAEHRACGTGPAVVVRVAWHARSCPGARGLRALEGLVARECVACGAGGAHGTAGRAFRGRGCSRLS